MNDTQNEEPVLLIGNGKLSASIYVCLINAGHLVDFYSDHPAEAIDRVNLHLKDSSGGGFEVACKPVENMENSKQDLCYRLAIIITPEDLSQKITCIRKAEELVHSDAVIAINTEAFALSTVQKKAAFPARIIGANWSEPAHTTCFLEIISNTLNPKELVEAFYRLSRSWQKDPYVLYNDCGIRARMMCAMIREAFYLFENGYVSIEDIDRACRNDAGFYLPFAGNFRYMDLMGAYMYGIVMKDLNPELCNTNHLPGFFEDIIEQGGDGMENNHGIYRYQNGEANNWDEAFRKFSYQIQEIIQKYTPDYTEENNNAQVLTSSVHD